MRPLRRPWAATAARIVAAAWVLAACLPALAGAKPTAPAASRPAVDAEALRVLKDLEAAGEKYTTLRAEIDYQVVLRALGDTEARTGWVAYQKADAKAKAPTKFRVTFETLKQGAGKTLRAVVDYVFDGQWLTVAKHRIKQVTEYQLAAKGQRIEPLRIGKGPFPLPFGQRVDDVVAHFVPTLRKPARSDPPKTVCLRLVTRPEHRKDMPVERLDLWVDRATRLPVKIRSRAKNGDTTTVTFKNIRTNRQVSADVFRVPRRLGWQRVVRPLKGSRAAAP